MIFVLMCIMKGQQLLQWLIVCGFKGRKAATLPCKLGEGRNHVCCVHQCTSGAKFIGNTALIIPTSQ